MLSRMIMVSLGIGCVAWFPVLPSFAQLVTTCLVLWLCTSRPCQSWLTQKGCIGIRMFALGAVWGVLHGYQVMQSQLPVDWETKPVWLTGMVVGLPEKVTVKRQPNVSGNGKFTTVYRFNLRLLDGVCTDKIPEAASCYTGVDTVRLSWYGQNEVIPGQVWRLSAMLKRPHSMANPNGFDYHTWLIRQSIGAVGYVSPHGSAVLLSDDRWSVDRLRQRGSDTLDNVLATTQYAGIFKALLIGDKRGISPSQWELFAHTGTTHLMVISGLHVGLISALAFYLARTVSVMVWRCWRSECIAGIAAMVTAALYSVMAGFSLPTQRALVMICVLMAAIIARREIAPSQGLVSALMLCLLLDPLASVSASFWLSFVAVAILLYGSVGRRSVRTSADTGRLLTQGTVWRSQYLVFVGLLPVLWLTTGQVSLIAPIANLVAVPLFSVLVVPFAFCAALGGLLSEALASYLWLGLDWILAQLMWLLHGLNNTLGSAVINAVKPDNATRYFLLLFAIIGMLVVLLPKGIPGRAVGAALLLPLLLFKPKPLEQGSLTLQVLDVGQGLAIVISTRTHTLVYDVGAESELFSVTRSVVLPFLRATGVSSIDRLVLSHGDNDHAGGWRALAQQLPVGQIHYGQWLAGFDTLNTQPCDGKMRWQWDGIEFQYLHPPPNEMQIKDAAYSSNNHSCVLKVSTPRISFLLTGDIERDVELRLVEQVKEQLTATVLIAPHHGSATSSSWPFIRTVNPEHVVMSSGYLNRFGHPNASVLNRYRQLNVKIHNTSEQGAVAFKVNSDQLLTVYHYRDSYQHYWL